MSTNTDPNANRKPSEPFRYRPRPKLEPEDEALSQQMLQLGMLDVTHEEAAAVLGVSRSSLEAFWKEHPSFREHFEAGKQLDKVRLRKTLRMHAQLDPGTARYLSKQMLGMSDDPSKAKLDEQATKNLKGMSREEANKRILELTPKLIGSNVPRETGKDDGNQGQEADGAAAGQRSAELLRSGGRGGSAQAPQAQGRSVPLGPQQEGGGKQGPGQALEKLQARLAELEASAVRKNPRKDGAPHTDRTKLDEQRPGPRKEGPDRDANTRQEMRPAHAPPRLPGRLGNR